jgi:LysR family transcriptional regulator, benzoate and cis,cis-muconate-responsive activator of ben and cat genes
MELRHLRYFVAVAEELSFSRAAQRLHVSQPPLSRQIRDLEDELMVKLLERDRQSVQLTRTGKAILEKARQLIHDADELRTEARKLGQESQEELQIGYAPAPAAALIPQILSRYHALAPRTAITLHDLSLSEILGGITSSKLDAAVTLRPRPGEMRGFKFLALRRYSVGIICANSSPWAQLKSISPSDIPMSKLIGYSAADFPEYHEWVAGVLGVNQTRVKFIEQCDGVLSIITAVEIGVAPAVVGEFTKFIAGGRIQYVPFEKKPSFMDVGLLHRTGEVQEKVKRLITVCSDIKTKLGSDLFVTRDRPS